LTPHARKPVRHPSSMNQTTVDVIIPSRVRASQRQFVERAISSIAAQSASCGCIVSVIVAVDKGQAHELDGLAERFGVEIVESPCEHGQAASLNAAISRVHAQMVAFLEDDDQWLPAFLSTALRAMDAGARFVSSTQLEVDVHGNIIRINDFPTMSGWVMSSNVLDQVGSFDETYRLHLDNEWLGRLSLSEVTRCHLIEQTAPLDVNLLRQVRPWLFNVLNSGGRRSNLLRHDSPYPLVRRLVHPESGMAQIATRSSLMEASTNEHARLFSAFGRIPW
jgi:glycosyltransferase involved in cell wall biosynthesis